MRARCHTPLGAAHCAAQNQSLVRATIHWNDVNDAYNTTFAMTPMSNAGLRLFDVRNPQAPVEVAYFNPGLFGTLLDRAANHTRYALHPATWGATVKDKSNCEAAPIWLTTRTRGFWVLEIEPGPVQLGLPLNPTSIRDPLGRPARPPELF